MYCAEPTHTKVKIFKMLQTTFRFISSGTVLYSDAVLRLACSGRKKGDEGTTFC